MMLDPTAHSAGAQTFMRALRISGGDPRRELLHKLVEAFSRLPYENISKIIKLSQHLDASDPFRLPEEVVEDHFREGLGGTCFSLTFTLQTILIYNGFECYPIMAHMRAGRNIHCGLVTTVDGVKFLIDPGYLLGQPVALNPRQAISFSTQFSHVDLVFDPEKHVYHLFTRTKEGRKWRYCFADRPTPTEDFLRYWQASFHQNAMHGICLNRATPNGLVYIRKDFMREITPQGQRNVNIKRHLHQTIEFTFGLRRQLVEQAMAAVETNMAWERELGLYHPQGKRYEAVGS